MLIFEPYREFVKRFKNATDGHYIYATVLHLQIEKTQNIYIYLRIDIFI